MRRCWRWQASIWQAMTLARAGHAVRVLERCPVPFEQAASQYAGAMIAPYCEAETAEPVVRDLGLEAAPAPAPEAIAEGE